jgi:broad specificity phosphatase PhoE
MPRVEEMMREKEVSLLEAFFQVPEVMEIIEERAKECLKGIKRVARSLPEGGSALVLSHGGTIEPAALLAKGNWDLKAIGGPLKECEGIVFKLDGDEIVDIYTARIKRWRDG